MRIAMLGTKGIPARYGGFETCVEAISKRLIKKGHVVTVFGVKENKKQPDFINGVGLKYVPQINIPTLDRLLREIYPIFSIISGNYDIVHFYGGLITLPFIWKLRRFNLIVSTDGLEWKRESYDKITKVVAYVAYFFAVKLSKNFIVDSHFVNIWIMRNWKKKGFYLPYGMRDFKSDINSDNLSKYNLEKNGYYLFVGRLVPEKGLHIALKAYSNLRTQKKFVIIGDDPFGGEYLKKLKSLANKNVMFLGFVYGEDYDMILKNAFIHIRPSINQSEGSNPATIEMMGIGGCIVASKVNQNIEVLGKSALFYDHNDHQKLSKILYNLENDLSEVEKLKELTLNRAQRKFNWDKITDDLEKIYLKTIKKKV